MSWQQYVDDHLMCEIEGNRLSAAAIIGQNGTVWAQSATFPKFKTEQILAIMKDFEEPGSLAPSGLFLGGPKYMVIQGDPGAVIRGKKGTGGITIKKTIQALIIGIYDEPMTPAKYLVEVVESLVWEQGGVREGFKAATIACVVSSVPTLVAVCKIPWAKANPNYTAQLVIAAYFITADKTILECARRNSHLKETLRRQSS